MTAPLGSSLSTNLSPSLAGDVRSIESLRSTASRDPKAAVQAVAKQFEALFMQELMKSMRQATLSSGMLENSGTKMGTEMLDTQFASQMTGLPGGLSQAIVKQIERQMGAANPNTDTGHIELKPLQWGSSPGVFQPTKPQQTESKPQVSAPAVQGSHTERQLSFVKQHTEAARSAEAATGIPASFMVAQAAHESGWGRREIKNADGSTSFNVFGIKAGGSWKGPVAEIVTTEYINGEPRKVVAKFRAYKSYEESFNDYARLMQNSPRYAPVLAQANTPEGFAQGLQKAGYATDPAYAEKLGRVINTTLRLQRMVT
ncbi:MAG: flagellar assembly peptidoglycan hydrolase FlgJ [Rhizobacter sp.]